ncbi:cardiolipin synthase [Niveibacterium sp. SC-1]|uniref:cardiolipin synthase n=1 Tax=Niveibacterium sp. SC-1 TaxID=3135646 RepID=UPI00311F11C6
MNFDHLLGPLAAGSHIVIVTVLVLRVLGQRHPPGTSLAWMLLAIVVPYFGAGLYLLIGERPLGRRRGRHAAELLPILQAWVRRLPEARQQADEQSWLAIRRTAQGSIGLPALGGNQLELRSDTDAILRALIADIETARHTVLMEFYIWYPGGIADEVIDALCRAALRGVACRVLLDSAGSQHFFRSRLPRQLREAGVAVVAALPVSLVRAAFVRFDLRLHRKNVVIDGRVGWTGSMNLVDPGYFKQGAGVGQWIDAMCRLEGPAVEVLAGVFLWDWCVETGQALDMAAPGLPEVDILPRTGGGEVQVLPSGPGFEGEGAHRLLLAALYAARDEIVLTTPYFVPDEPLSMALEAAALRGVRVTVILPARVDSLLVRYASRSFFDRLLDAGVRIMRFEGGLLHTKSVTVDRELSLFGTTNLDVRSFRLNFELTLIIYDPRFTRELCALQESYLASSQQLNQQRWNARGRGVRLAENAARLVSPLL